MSKTPKGRLELTWVGKDMALIPFDDGKYDYTWVDPADPRAREVKSIEVTETIGDSAGQTGADENLLIVGDSGDALRSLGTIPEWSSKFLGQVKLVYIDPPFNTEQTFEHYADQLEHSVWLTMMRDRIRDIKPLLARDASIWVHLDDAEVHRMRVLLDEEFGPENFVASVVWKRRNDPRNTAPHVSMDHDVILVYARDLSHCEFNSLPRTQAMDSAYTNPDDDPRGPWRRSDLAARNAYSQGLYSITTPGGREIAGPPSGSYWRVSKAELERLDADGRIFWGPDGKSRPYIKRFLSEVRGGRVPSTVWSPEEVGFVRNGKEETRALVGDVFSTPKPERLLERVLQIGSNPGDLVLDCFAGSGTTAAVAHKTRRRWVTVELQPSTAEAFVIPRLTKVVKGDDPGGVTTKKERVSGVDLPDGVTPEDAQRFTTLLGKVAKTVEGTDDKTLRALRAATKTKDESTVQWSGGGGFTVARMGPSMYEVDEDGEVYLSPEATNGAWSRSIAGQLKFTHTPDDPVFCGQRRRQRLAVIDGVADESVVRTVVESLSEGERVVVVAKSVLPEAEALLADLSPGSRIRKAPDDLFRKATVR